MGGTGAQSFGSDWTARKLEILEKYLHSYTTALKHQKFRKAYIDAFAGTGYIKLHTSQDNPKSLFPDIVAPEPQEMLEGSVRRALKVEPRFDRYIFVERSAANCAHLQRLKEDFPNLANDIDVRQGDANKVLQELCGADWSNHRAVLFLDPFGMQVEWNTIEAVAETKAIDLWLLFPLGIGVNRLLTRSGEIPEEWRQRLDKLLGTTDWFDEFYEVKHEKGMFEEAETRVKKATMETIGKYFIRRLKSVFAGVADSPAILTSKANNPLYLFCFAVGNPRAVKPGLSIANHLIRTI
jgi:three-Cys-motif partner protein